MNVSSLYVALGLLAVVASWYLMPRRWVWLLSRLGRLLSGFRSHSTSVDGVTWRYLQGGTGPTLVILHGVAGEADHWLGVAGPLRRDFRILIPELPGFIHAPSERPLDFHVRAQAGRLEQWLNALDIEQCILAGNSMGGAVASCFAAQHPQRVRALWLMSPFGVSSGPETELMAEFKSTDRNPFAVKTINDYSVLIGKMFHERYAVPYVLQRTGFLNFKRLGQRLSRILRETLCESCSLEDHAANLTMPVLIEWGESDPVTHPAGADILAALIANAEVHTHPKLGHLPMLEQPTLVVQTFREFAARAGLADP